MPYYIFAWIASISSAFVVIISKLTSKHSIPNPWLFNFLWTLVTVLFVVPPAVYYGASLPKEWLSITAAALFSVLWYACYILAIYRLDVSTLSPLFNFRTVFAVLLGVLFLQENFTFIQVVFFGIIIGAGIFATIDEKFRIRSFFTPAIGIGLLAMLFLALNNVFINRAVAQNGVWTTNLWMGILSLFFVSLTFPLFKKDITKIKIPQLFPVGLMGIFQTITNFTLTVALGVNVGITSLIMSIPFSMMLAFLFSVFAPKLLEKHTAKVYAVRFIAATIMILAALRLSR